MLQTVKDLRKSRMKSGITQSLLAEVTGLHTSAITRIESGKIDCRASTLELLSDGIDIINKNKKHSINGVVVIDKTSFENSIYRSVIQKIEKLESDGKYNGNGHHLAQNVVELISNEICL